MGDAARFIYYVYRGLPYHFLLGGGCAVLMDFFVLGQMFYYSSEDLESSVIEDENDGENDDNVEYEDDQENINDPSHQIKEENEYENNIEESTELENNE